MLSEIVILPRPAKAGDSDLKYGRPTGRQCKDKTGQNGRPERLLRAGGTLAGGRRWPGHSVPPRRFWGLPFPGFGDISALVRASQRETSSARCSTLHYLDLVDFSGNISVAFVGRSGNLWPSAWIGFFFKPVFIRHANAVGSLTWLVGGGDLPGTQPYRQGLSQKSSVLRRDFNRNSSG